ncbi:MAG: hypothetical protein ACXWIU_05700, partial [Limisphaerales bacterium]
MNTKTFLALAAATGLICANLSAGPFQTVSVPDPTLVPASAGGDSLAPMLTPDGRFVLFSSTAANLATNANGAPLSQTFPAKLNVFLRDRTFGTTALISGNQSQFNGGNGDSLPSDVSTNGQFVAFESSASDLVPNDTNNVTDIFLRDTVSNITTLISVAPDGSPANGVSRSAVMTPDGRYVAFVSAASNLVSGDLNNICDVFLRDTWSNATTLISVGAKATTTSAPFTNSCESPEITPDGRYVAFYSTATNLVPGVSNPGEIYVRDIIGGTTICASLGVVTTNGAGAITNVFYDHCISADGQFVAYQTQGTTLALNSYPVGVVLRYNVATATTDIIDRNGYAPVGLNEEIRTLDMTPDGRFIVYLAYVAAFGPLSTIQTTGVKLWDAQTGTSIVVSGNTNITGVLCDAPSIDPTCRFVTFISNAPGLVTNAISPGYHCYIRDLQLNTMTLVDVNTNGATASPLPTALPRLSGDSRYVAFQSFDNQLVPGDVNRAHDIFVRDLVTGNIDLISAREASLPAPSTAANLSATSPSISTDGRFVAFSSLSENLVTNDNNNTRDVFVRDLLTSTTTLVSKSTNGNGASSVSFEPSISGDGRFVAFSSYATNIANILGFNYWENVYLADLQTSGMTIISKAGNGSASDGHSYSPILSSDGKYLLFRSQANNISTNSVSGITSENLFLRYVQSSNTVALTYSGVTNAVMTPDGRYVIFSGNVQNVGTGLFVWDSVRAIRIYTNLSVGLPSALAISADASHFCYVSTSLYDNINGLVGSAIVGRPRWTIRYSADGHFLTFCTLTGVSVYNTQTHTTKLVSHSYLSPSSAANGTSDSPDISADGHYIIYRSTASDLVPNFVAPDTNAWPKLFIYD